MKGKMKNNEIKNQVEGYLSKLFSGRVPRVNYLVGQLIVALGVPIAIAITTIPLTAMGLGGLSVVPALIVWAVGIIYGLSFATRRFHDIGRGAIELLWFLVPFVNIYFLFLIYLKAGDDGENRFGPSPERKVDIKDMFKVG